MTDNTHSERDELVATIRCLDAKYAGAMARLRGVEIEAYDGDKEADPAAFYFWVKGWSEADAEVHKARAARCPYASPDHRGALDCPRCAEAAERAGTHG